MAKSIIGCDLNERYCQISYYDEELQEPKTLDAVAYPVSDLYVKAVQQDGNEELRKLSDFLGKVLCQSLFQTVLIVNLICNCKKNESLIDGGFFKKRYRTLYGNSSIKSNG